MGNDSADGNWTTTLEPDRGWGHSAWEGADEFTPLRNKLLKTKLVAPGLLCMSDSNVYIFLTSLNIWSVACAKQSITFVNSLIGTESATVNYGDAFEPYVNFIEREASDRIAKDIPQSICIGTERLRVTLVPGGLNLSRCESLMGFMPDTKKLLSSLCYMPLSIKGWPRSWVRTPDYSVYKFISPLFTDPLELKTMEWAIGNALVDPHSFSKTVILHGDGGHGKSTVLNTITSSLLGCCGTIPDSALISLTGGVSSAVASIVASNRIVIAGDVGSESKTTNLTVIKTLTGHDFISVPPSRVKTACTLFYASNRLDDPYENPEWLTPAILRRVIVIFMNAKIIEGFSGRVPQDQISRLDFALRCVHTRLSNPYMPVSSLSMLFTVMGSRFYDAMRYLAPIHEDDTIDEDLITAGSIIAGILSITVESVGQLARRISPYGVKEIDGVYYIRDIAPIYNAE